jgi:acyl-CoA synthetase (NDP forming)
MPEAGKEALGPSRHAVAGVQHWLDPLLRPASVAFVGASSRAESPGNTMLRVAAVDGYAGRVFAVNPKRSMIEGTPCYPDLASLPESVDHVVIGLSDAQVEASLCDAIEHGARAATIFAGCDMSDVGDRHLLARLQAIAREAGIAMCGPNSMGFLNPRVGLRITGFPSSVGLKPGHAAFITQSGSAFSALAYNDQRLKYSICVSSGREMTVGSEDYIDWALDQPETRVVGLFLETARSPDRFVAVLAKAEALNIPVVALKVGRTAMSARFAASHSGAITGNAAAYEAVFRSHGVIAVDTLDQLAADLLLLSTVPNAPPGGLAGLHDSGGEREMVVDLAQREGVSYAPIGVATKEKMRPHLDSGLQPDNPLDVWGSGRDFETHVEACMDAMLEDPATAIGVLFQDVREGSYIATGFTQAVVRAAGRSAKPVAVVSNYASVNHRGLALAVTEAGVPVIDGTEEGLRAIRALFDLRDRRATARTIVPNVPREIVARWRQRLTQSAPLDEAEALALLSDYGIGTPQMEVVETQDGVLAAAERIGFPVALKTAAAGVRHKSDVAGVMLGLADGTALTEAHADVAARLGGRMIVAKMAEKGTEIAFGLVHDPQFGPFVMLAAGGIWIEALNDRAVSLAPVTVEAAHEMISELRICRLLDGGRGRKPADRDALAHAFARFSMIAADLGDLIDEMDVNPLFVGPGGCCAVDALLIARGHPTAENPEAT